MAMETSDLSHIVNITETPMAMFAEFYGEAKRFSDPNTFSDAMCIASRSEWVLYSIHIFIVVYTVRTCFDFLFFELACKIWIKRWWNIKSKCIDA